MFIAFGMPAAACILFTIHELPQHPWLILLYVISCFPVAVLFVLRRLMSRYALAVYENGDLEVTFPFSRKVLPSGSIEKITADSRYVAATQSRMSWIRFVGQKDKIHLSLARSTFSDQVFADFFAAAKARNPKLIIEL